MSGLLLKEFLSAKKYLRSLAGLLFLYIGLSLVWKNVSFLTGVSALVSVMIGFSSFSFDVQSKWDCYALSLPVRRKDVVKSRYLFSLICVGVGLLYILIFGLLLVLITHESTRIFFQSLLASSSCALFLSLILPVNYRFGAERGRILLAAIALVIVGLFTLTDRLFSNPPPLLVNYQTFLFLLALFSALVLYLSYRLSCAIYAKKEF
ncbi:MAG: ABC-2 transporter permease [Christensenellales bacterium]